MGINLVIAGGKVVTPNGIRSADVGVRGGRIVKVGTIGRIGRQSAHKVIDAKGCLVFPGAIDPHVHFDLSIGPGMKTADDFDLGTRAAVAGGVTTFIDYTTPEPGQRPLSAFKARRAIADKAVRCDYSLHNVLIGFEAKWAADLKRLVAVGAPSVKLFMIYADRGWQADDGRLVQVMSLAKKLRLMVCVHAENDALIQHYTARVKALSKKKVPGAFGLALARPPLCEEEAAARAILLARASGAHLHLVHLSTAAAAKLVGQARREGAPISAETCPQYLALDHKKLAEKGGHRYGCCPPLRSAAHRKGLMEALKDGSLSTVGTDHCCFNTAQKNTWGGDFTKIPYGLPGVETMLRVTWTLGPLKKQLSIERWVAMHTEGPAKLFGLWPRKGSLQIGTDADIVVWDPKQKKKVQADKLQTASDWDPYEGRVLAGMARHVFLRGVEVASEGKCLRRPFRGKFVLRSS